MGSHHLKGHPRGGRGNQAEPSHGLRPNVKPLPASNVLNSTSSQHRPNPLLSSSSSLTNRPHPTARAHSFSKNSTDRASATATSIAEVWRAWPSLSILIWNVPDKVTTFMIWEAFKAEGAIESIDLFEDLQGKGRMHQGKGKVRFRSVRISPFWILSLLLLPIFSLSDRHICRPPPRTDFWRSGKYTMMVEGQQVVICIKCDTQRKDQMIESPVRSGIQYPAQIVGIIGHSFFILDD